MFGKINKNKRTYIDANKLANRRRDIKNKKVTDAERAMTEDEFKTAWNEKCKLLADNTETESDDNETFLGSDNEGLKYCKVIVEDILDNEKTTDEDVN